MYSCVYVPITSQWWDKVYLHSTTVLLNIPPPLLFICVTGMERGWKIDDEVWTFCSNKGF